jgi:methionyl-tRNA formyltransferase
MKLIFAGTPEFAAVSLEALLAAGHTIPLVLTQPDRPAGRGMKLAPSAVKAAALGHGLRVEQPLTLKAPEAQAMLRAAIDESGAELMVVVAYGLILPQAVLDLPVRGCLNIHASLLPRWRGAAPIQRAIQACDRETGVGIMQMEAGLDTGPLLLEEAIPIADADTAATLHDKLAALGGRLIVSALDRIDQLVAKPQSLVGVTYAHKLDKSESSLDFARSAHELWCQIRAFDPFPGSSAALGGEVCKIWSALPADGAGEPGEILAVGPAGVVVACGQGALRITELQKAGGKRLKAREFLTGTPLVPGARFAAKPPLVA